ncbi:mediator complex, subunit Med8 [Xylogone sp. PMI_703]|nr:mediator complex, subunit Med8 [Xylogone sp. PMI_703]
MQTTLRQEDIKTLEQTRQRLFQLTNSIESLRTKVLRTAPLPEWSSLQTSASILAGNVKTLIDHLSAHSDIFYHTVVYPQTNYPGRTQEGLLGQLLRKKWEPQVEGWVDEGRAISAEKAGSEAEDLGELWKWAGDWIGDRVAKYAMEENDDMYTMEEREIGIENVNTGLRRKFDEDESDEDEDEDMEDENGTLGVTAARRTSMGQMEYEMSGVPKPKAGNAKAKSVEEILRFATSGFDAD